jgi:endonuclease YncB( thermonuclease family)
MRFLSLRKPRSARRRRSWGRGGLVGQIAVTLLVFGVCAVLVARLDSLGLRSLAGTAVVHDGDTLTVGGERIRLSGIDAFELDQNCFGDEGTFACGRAARSALVELVGGAAIRCDGNRRDRYRRLLAVCTAGETDLNREMVSAGWAVSYGGYRTQEIAARLDGRGAWAGEFATPAEWRATNGKPREARHDIVSRLLEMVGQYLF